MEQLFWGSGTFSHKDSHSWATDADVLLVVTGVGRFWEEREGISPPSGSGQKKKNRAGLGPEDYSCVPGIMCKKKKKGQSLQGRFKLVFSKLSFRAPETKHWLSVSLVLLYAVAGGYLFDCGGICTLCVYHICLSKGSWRARTETGGWMDALGRGPALPVLGSNSTGQPRVGKKATTALCLT